MQEESKGDEKAYMRQARTALKPELRRGPANLDVCAGCGAEAPLCEADALKFMNCPCKLVCYYQKSCQVAHWKQHKLVCSYQAKQKELKKETEILVMGPRSKPKMSSGVALTRVDTTTLYLGRTKRTFPSIHKSVTSIL